MSDEPRGPEEPAGDLVRRLAADLAALLRLYGRAVAGHLRGLGRDVAAAALMIGAALALGVFALGLAVAVLVLVLAIWLPGWLAAAVALGAVVAVMGALVFLGTRRVRRRRASWAAMVEEEVRWLRSLFPREN